MNFTYLASSEDFRALEEAIQIVYSSKLKFIFQETKILDKTSIISFDSKYIYIWTRLKFSNLKRIKKENYFLYKIPHSLDIKKEHRIGWKSGIYIDGLRNFLPKTLFENNYEFPIISGSLFGDFIKNQIEMIGKNNNPYITKAGFLATIVHEFGHIYYRQHKNWWFSSKQKNLKLLNSSLMLFKNSNQKIEIEIEIPHPFLFSEVFAFCCEYEASKVFFPKHKENLDKHAYEIIKKSIDMEKQKNLDIEDSVFSDRTSHEAALILGKILIEKYPKNWPEKIIKTSSI